MHAVMTVMIGRKTVQLKKNRAPASVYVVCGFWLAGAGAGEGARTYVLLALRWQSFDH